MENEFIKRELEKYENRQPIYVEKIAEQYAAAFGVDLEEAKKIVEQDLEAEMENKSFNLRKYRDGIYYLTEQGPLGELGISKKQLKYDKYFAGSKGYLTGPTLLNKLGLCTMLPKDEWIATYDVDPYGTYDDELHCRIIQSRLPVTEDNVKYLQILDAIKWVMDGYADCDDPDGVIKEYIYKNDLDLNKLGDICDRYYEPEVLLILDRVLKAGGRDAA